MNDLQLAELLRQDLKNFSPPADTGTLTISVITHNTIQLTTTPAGGVNAWVGALIKFTSGVADGFYATVIRSNGDIIEFATPMAGNIYPSAADTLELKGGPLSTARTYMFSPPGLTTEFLDSSGIRNFVTVSPESGKVFWKGFHGHSTDGAEARRDVYSLEVLAEVPDDFGTIVDKDTAEEMAVELPLMKEQIVFFMHKFRADEAKRISSSKPIKYNYGSIQRQGAPVMKCVVISMEVQVL